MSYIAIGYTVLEIKIPIILLLNNHKNLGKSLKPRISHLFHLYAERNGIPNFQNAIVLVSCHMFYVITIILALHKTVDDTLLTIQSHLVMDLVLNKCFRNIILVSRQWLTSGMSFLELSSPALLKIFALKI